MKERPIIFSVEMVRAILDGRKTQTRRIVNWQKIAKQTGCTKGTLGYSDTFNSWAVFNGNGDADLCLLDCPYGKPGDRLWVRESFAVGPALVELLEGEYPNNPPVQYKADGGKASRWTPSIHMPRWASRLTLEITHVRVERLQNVSAEDAEAEGLRNRNGNRHANYNWRHEMIWEFEDAWDKINGKKHPWSSNPWVWVVEFQTTNTRHEREGQDTVGQ